LQVGCRACERCGAAIEHPRLRQRFCSSGCLRKLETGKYDPTVGMLQRLAKALGVPVTELLE
jgi:hypothetical protein